MSLLDAYLERPDTVILDGGLATQLETMGHSIDTELWSADLLQSSPTAIVDAHTAYLAAGADCIISASYQASREGFEKLGLDSERADKLIKLSVSLARRARDECLPEDHSTDLPPMIAASVGPYAAMLHDGSEYTGQYRATRDMLETFHKQRLLLLDSCGADVLAVETIPNAEEAVVLAELLKHVSTPAWISFACKDAAHLNDGTPIADVASLFMDHPTVRSVGVNCTAPQHVEGLLTVLAATLPGMPLLAYPNSGETYHAHDNSWSGEACGESFDVVAWKAAGAKMIGGCCRTGPSHVAAMRQLLIS